MVAVIKTGHSIARVLNYNENKVKEGVAEIISAVNYPMDAHHLSFTNKLKRLQNQAALNDKVSRNSVHISLNFDPSEKLSTARLQEIAEVYMQKIGLGEQPYLIYQHHDSRHPHIHIVSVKVRADGSRVDTQNIGCNPSEKARKEIEQAFGLKRPEDSKLKQQSYTLKPIALQKVQYGRSESKRAITNVLDAVLKDYKYTSLPELNAILNQYHVLAERGGENSRVFRNRGLVYRILDAQGNKVGVPIKASDFYSKPTLRYLEERFAMNNTTRQPFKARIKNAIDMAFLKVPKQPLADLMKTLEKDGISNVLRENENGIIYGITFVDHRTKCVFNGSGLGKPYSAKGLLERCSDKKPMPATGRSFREKPSSTPEPTREQSHAFPILQNRDESQLIETLLQPADTRGFVAGWLTKKKRKKGKSNHI